MNNADSPSGRIEKTKQNWVCLSALTGLWLFHAANNVLFLQHTQTPPSYDCGFHLQLSLNFLERFLNFRSETYFADLLASSGFYPPLGYAATTPFYLMFGISEDSAVLVNLAFLALLLGSVYRIGKTLSDPWVGLAAAALTSFFPFVYGISRVYYLESALIAMVAWSVLRLLETQRFSRPGASVLFGVSVGLGMMTKWTFALFLLGPVVIEAARGLSSAYRRTSPDEKNNSIQGSKGWAFAFILLGAILFGLAARSSRAPMWIPAALLPAVIGAGFLAPRELRNVLWNLAASGLAALTVCYPWYYIYWKHIFGIAAAHIQKSPLSLENLLYYPLVLQNSQLGPGFFLVLLLTPFLIPRSAYRTYLPVLVWALSSWALFTLIPFAFNDPRFIAPYLPALGLLMGKGILPVKSSLFRNAFILFCVLNGVWQFGMNTYEWPLPASNNMKLTKYGYITFWHHGVYGTGGERGREWPNYEIVVAFEDHVLESDSKALPTLRLLVDRPFFHQGAFQFYARARGNRWEAVFDRDPIPIEKELERILDSEAVLFSNSRQADDLYLGLGEKKPFELNHTEDDFFQTKFPEQQVYDLPDGTSVTLAFRAEPIAPESEVE